MTLGQKEDSGLVLTEASLVGGLILLYVEPSLFMVIGSITCVNYPLNIGLVYIFAQVDHPSSFHFLHMWGILRNVVQQVLLALASNAAQSATKGHPVERDMIFVEMAHKMAPSGVPWNILNTCSLFWAVSQLPLSVTE